ncbi:RTG1 [Candida jiufengensis]|uniref:RTG1 n=1 Tax=Candida jiufengensis TaxID=497108 RepID=UPI0022241274|nr:RTG1 [Candida jiufengensis]KAI5951019.1 RTG1 [Candida jiufengensis]
MSQFDTFLDNYVNDNFNNNSSNNNNNSNYQQNQQQHQQIPTTIKRENFDEFLSGSLDIKRQLSQSLGVGSSNSYNGSSSSYQQHQQHHHGGISKPHSRRNSAYIRSQEGSDNEQDDEVDENNINKQFSNDNNGGLEGDDDDKDQGNERKRRDNINDKIQELLTLIPNEYFITKEDSTSTQNLTTTKIKKEESPIEKSPSEEDINNTVSKTGTKDGKPNKGQILTKSVEYLQSLQNLIDENNRKEVELIMKLENLKLKKSKHQQLNNGENVPIRIGYTSAERALGEIGVGPCSEDYFKDVLVKSANSSKSSRKSLHN